MQMEISKEINKYYIILYYIILVKIYIYIIEKKK